MRSPYSTRLKVSGRPTQCEGASTSEVSPSRPSRVSSARSIVSKVGHGGFNGWCTIVRVAGYVAEEFER
jgi:hypothetical protein